MKCDGDSGRRGDSCTPCKQIDKCCVFRYDDRRKKHSSKAHLQRLQDRIAVLEEQQRTGYSRASENGSPTESTKAQTDGHYSSPRDDVTALSTTTGDTSIAQLDTHPMDRPTAFGTMEDDNVELLEPKNPMFYFDRDFRTEIPSWAIEARQVVVDRVRSTAAQLSADETGQLRYFGSSSNLHVASVLPSAVPQSPEPADERLEELADSNSLQMSLLTLFFTYQHPALQILHRETFMEDYAKGVKTQYFSQFLLNCILLRSVRLSDDESNRDVTSVYLRRAKHDLPGELEEPTIATIQGLCLLGDYLGSLCNDRALWLYPGIAFRLLYDFGLNQDCTDLVTLGYITEKEQKIRQITLWGCYTWDRFVYHCRISEQLINDESRLLSVYHGRPISIRLSDITVPRPTAEICGDQYHLMATWADLSTILTEILEVVNGPTGLLEQESTVFRLSRTGEKLLRWLKGLPVELQWNSKGGTLPAPGVCALHMQLYTTMILLHRPFADYAQNPSRSREPLTQQLANYTPAISRQICNENAIRIAKLLHAYCRQFGTKKTFTSIIHMIFTASLTLISQISTENTHADESEERKWLIQCLNTLNDLTPSFQIAGRVRNILKSILECCGYSELAKTGTTAGLETIGEYTPHSFLQQGQRHDTIEAQLLYNPTIPLSFGAETESATGSKAGANFMEDFDFSSIAQSPFMYQNGLSNMLGLEGFRC
jgi:hypothetical protein